MSAPRSPESNPEKKSQQPLNNSFYTTIQIQFRNIRDQVEQKQKKSSENPETPPPSSNPRFSIFSLLRAKIIKNQLEKKQADVNHDSEKPDQHFPSFLGTIHDHYIHGYGSILATRFGQKHENFFTGFIEGAFTATLTHWMEKPTDLYRLQEGMTVKKAFVKFLHHPLQGYTYRSLKFATQLGIVYSTKAFVYDGLESIHSSPYNESIAYSVGASWARIIVNPIGTVWCKSQLKENENKSIKEMMSTVTIKDLFTRGVPTVIARDCITLPLFYLLTNQIKSNIKTGSPEFQATTAGILAMLVLTPITLPLTLVADYEKAHNISAKNSLNKLYLNGGILGILRTGKLCIPNALFFGGALALGKELTKEAKDDAVKKLKK